MRTACLRAIGAPSTSGVTTSSEDSCLAAALAAVDPRAIYDSAKETTERRENAQKAPVGIGLEVWAMRQPGDELRIVSMLSGGPRERAGLLSGDLIFRIDRQDVRPMTTHQAMMSLRGEPGTAVSLELERGAAREKVLLVAHRARIRVKAVGCEPGQGKVAALRISRFDDGTAQELGASVEEILCSASTVPTSLAVDLHADPGRSLDAVLRVAELFTTQLDAAVGRVIEHAG